MVIGLLFDACQLSAEACGSPCDREGSQKCCGDYNCGGLRCFCNSDKMLFEFKKDIKQSHATFWIVDGLKALPVDSFSRCLYACCCVDFICDYPYPITALRCLDCNPWEATASSSVAPEAAPTKEKPSGLVISRQ
jgi:hypothetical protein